VIMAWACRAAWVLLGIAAARVGWHFVMRLV
jgi:hypothetical protein